GQEGAPHRDAAAHGHPVVSLSEQFSAEVFGHLDLARNGIEATSAELVGSDHFPRLLTDWFSLLWDITRATIPVVSHALARIEARKSSTFDAALADFYRAKLTEEAGHDEMLLSDLERLGVPRSEVAARTPSAPVTAMVGSQYYWIDYVHP